VGKRAVVPNCAVATAHSRVAASLIGLGWVALQQKDWSAARRHFAAALPLIEQLETAPQALGALAGIAHWQPRAGQPEQALALIGLVQHHPSSYRETKDRLVRLEAALQAALSQEQVVAALVAGKDSELWDITMVVVELEPPPIQVRPAPTSVNERIGTLRQ